MVVAPAPTLSLSAAAGGAHLLFRQLFDADTGTFTYLLADVTSRQRVLIDSVFEQHGRDLALIRELGRDLMACLDTHADHVTGSWRRERRPSTQGWAATPASGISWAPWRP